MSDQEKKFVSIAGTRDVDPAAIYDLSPMRINKLLVTD
jgi:hypothetical protein